MKDNTLPNHRRLHPIARLNKAHGLTAGGLTPFTTIDFPGHLAAVIFCQGCPWRCTYCHNPHLLPARPQHNGAGTYNWSQLLQWMKNRQGLLDGIVFSGGEPLLQRSLPQAIAETRQLGFAVALHTAGAYPQRLAAVLPDLDWVGFDIKAPFDDYRRITGVDNGHKAQQALLQLLHSATGYEIRCTVDPHLLDRQAIIKIARQLAAMGVNRLVLQPCRSNATSSQQHLPQNIIDAAKNHLPHIELRET